METMPLTAQSLNLFNSQSLPLAQAGVSFLPQFSAPYKEGVSYTKRIPNCQKCGQHGRKSRLKGHKRVCPFKDCNCAKCQVVTERQKLMADQIKIRRRQRKDTIMTLTRDNLKALNAVNAAAIAQPYMNNLSNLNMLCNQMSSLDAKQDLENQQPMQFNSNMNATTSFPHLSQSSLLNSQINANSSSAFSPASKADSPQLVSSPLSTIGTEISLSPQQFPRANSFDLGLLNNQGGFGQQQLLSALTANQLSQDLKLAPNSNSNGFELTPPQSAGLAAPIPVNPIQPSGGQLSYDNLLALSQLLAPQPAVSTPSLLQFINPQQPTLNLQDLLSVATLLQQFQGQQLSPPPTEKSPHKPNGFVDVCSV